MLLNCTLCHYVGDTVGLLDREQKPAENVTYYCPNCGYNTTIKNDLERARKYAKDAQMFDPVELLSSGMPPEEVIKKRIEWTRLGTEGLPPNDRLRLSEEYEISIIEDAPHDLTQLDEKIAVLINEMRKQYDHRKVDELNFQRKILCWIKAVLLWKQESSE